MAELLEVPLIKRGIYNGFPVENIRQAVEDTQKAMPYLIEGLLAGSYRGQRAALNSEPIPGFINLNHDQVAPGKLKSWSEGVRMEVDTRLINGEEWVIGNFRGVDPELAQLLSVGFPGRSVEILPDFQNPETGDVYPVVLRSVAFLDQNTKPAVPQYPGYAVKLSRSDQGVLSVRVDVPVNNNQQEEIDMDNKAQEQDVVKLAQEDIIKMKARLDTLDSENVTLRGAVTTMKQEKDELAKDVQAYRQQAQTASIEKFCAELERDYNVTPAGISVIKPVIGAENGVVKLADGEKPVKEGAADALLELVKLAKKNALFLPEKSGTLPQGKQQEEILTNDQRREKAIQKFMADKSVAYDVALLAASKDPEFKDLFNPLRRYEQGGN